MALDIEPLVDLAIATARKSPSRPRKVGAVLVARQRRDDACGMQ